MTQRLRDIAALLGASTDGLSETALAREITGVNTIEGAQTGELTFLANPKYAHFTATTQASCILVTRDFVRSIASTDPVTATLLQVDNPQAAFAEVVEFFAPANTVQRGIQHSTAVIHETAQIHSSTHIAAHVSIGAGCMIGENVVLHSGVALYDDVSIGANTTLHANVVCYRGTSIGARCTIHAGTVIGADGFGFAEQKDGSFTKIPQIGNVVISDDVEIGANCTIDRAALGSTRLENGVKLDNLIHVAHNVVIGENTAIAAQTGVSGSTKLGKRNRIAGQVGFVGHIKTADDVVVFAQSGVSKAISAQGIYFGYPAKPHKESLRIEAVLRQLPDLAKEVQRLKRELEQLKELHAPQKS